MNPKNKCPNCGQYKIESRSALLTLIVACGVSTVFIITIPLLVVLIPFTIIAALIPSQRRTYRFCRNCKWSDEHKEKIQPV